MHCNNNIALYRRGISFAVVFAVCCFFLGTAPAEANSSWQTMQGHSACGGLTKNGKLQDACGKVKAKKQSKAVGKCPKGSFFDIGTWSCYTCPTGYKRTVNHVAKDKACSKNVTNTTAKAKYFGKKKCPSGSFLDMRNGGECWKCPAGFKRTTAGVHKHNACGKIGKKARSADFKGRACPVDGSFTDPRKGGECWTCPDGYVRTASAVTGNKACAKKIDFKSAQKQAALTCPKGQIFDFIDGGTCWSCPANYTRTSSSIKSKKACKTTDFIWKVPTRKLPGLFGLGRSFDTVMAELIFHRTELDEAIKATAKKLKKDSKKFAAAEWIVLNTEPWKSVPLTAVVLDKVLAAAKKPKSQRTDIEQAMLDRLGVLFQNNQQFLAAQQRQAFEMWKRASKLAQDQRNMNNMTGLMGGVVAPPDIANITKESIQGAAGAATFVAASVSGGLLRGFKFLAPYAAKAAARAGHSGAAFGPVAGAAGPVAIVVSAAITIGLEIDKFAQIAKADAKIRQQEDMGKNPIDIGVLLQRKDGQERFSFHWMTITNAATQPNSFFKWKMAYLKGETTAPAPRNDGPLSIGGM